ncbi:MAG: thermonuclease family protein [Candidatus Eremiobacteraeota bacterium]|nr:thermonuclease family protein [Candidatus Eremiobacteraeota bacterium]
MKTLPALLVIFALALTSCAFAQDFTTQVMSVKDCTAIITGNGTLTLNCVACPADGQPFAVQARQYLQGLIQGKQVKVHVVDTDESGRLISQVSVDGQDAGLSIVQKGLAWYDGRFRQDEALKNAADAAKAAGIGIWSQPGTLAPWIYSAQKQSNSTPGSDPNWKYDPGTHSYYYDPSSHGHVPDPSKYKVFCNYCGTYHRDVTQEGCDMIFRQDDWD